MNETELLVSYLARAGMAFLRDGNLMSASECFRLINNIVNGVSISIIRREIQTLIDKEGAKEN